MEQKNIQRITLVYAAEEQETACLIEETLEKSIQILNERWELPTPRGVQVHVMTSWFGFSINSAPWFRKILLLSFFPFWVFRARRSWRYAGGWALHYKGRPVIGIKPARLIEASRSGLGADLFVEPDSPQERVQNTTCHELTHAFTGHLRLPVWLHEGLAMRAVDHLLGKSTVLPQSAQRLPELAEKIDPASYRRVKRSDLLPLIYQYARSYWLVRYFEETKPLLLTDLLRKKIPQQVLESEIATAYHEDAGQFWRNIDNVISEHYKDLKEG